MTGGGPAPTEADFPFWTEEKLRIADTDMNGHVNNGATGAFCEAGRAELMMEGGGDPRARGFAMAVARVAIDYRREIHYPGRVRVGSRVSRLGTSSVTVAQGLFKDGELFATAESVMVILDPATRRPMAMPEAVRARFVAFAGPGGVG